MPYTPEGLYLQVIDIRIQSPPSRALEFQIQMYSRMEGRIVVLGSDVRVTLNNSIIGRGNLLRVLSAPARGAAFSASNEMLGEISVPLTREALDWIESSRVGDLEYWINMDVVVAPLLDGDPELLGAPWLQPVGLRYSNPVRDRIPQSEWLKYLRTLGWSETELLEIPTGLRRETYPAAESRFKEATDHYRNGQWEAALASCRKAIEALAMSKTPEEATRRDMRRLRDFFPEGEKGEQLDALMRQFGDFLHLARHEQVAAAKVDFTRADALLGLMITGSFLRFVSI